MPEKICINCKFSSDYVIESEPPQTILVCRFHPPQPVRDTKNPRLRARWPHVKNNDFCGQYSGEQNTSQSK